MTCRVILWRDQGVTVYVVDCKSDSLQVRHLAHFPSNLSKEGKVSTLRSSDQQITTRRLLTHGGTCLSGVSGNVVCGMSGVRDGKGVGETGVSPWW